MGKCANWHPPLLCPDWHLLGPAQQKELAEPRPGCSWPPWFCCCCWFRFLPLRLLLLLRLLRQSELELPPPRRRDAMVPPAAGRGAWERPFFYGARRARTIVPGPALQSSCSRSGVACRCKSLVHVAERIATFRHTPGQQLLLYGVWRPRKTGELACCKHTSKSTTKSSQNACRRRLSPARSTHTSPRRRRAAVREAATHDAYGAPPAITQLAKRRASAIMAAIVDSDALTRMTQLKRRTARRHVTK